MSERKLEPLSSRTIVPAQADYARPAVIEPVVGEYYGRPQSKSVIARGYLYLVGRQKWTLLLTFLLVMGGGLAWIFTRTPLYRSTAEILVQPLERGSGAGDDPTRLPSVMGRVRGVATETKLIRSRDLLDEAFATLPLSVRQKGFNTSATTLESYPVNVTNSRDTDVVNIEVTARDPEAAATFANQLVKSNLNRHQETTRRIAEQATQYVDGQLTQCERNLKSTWAELTTYKQRHGVYEISVQAAADAQGLANLESSSIQAEAEMVRARAARDLLEKELGKTAAVIRASVTQSDNPLLKDIDGAIEKLEQERASMLQEYLPTAPEIRALDDQIADAKNRKAAIIDKKTETTTDVHNPVIDALQENYINALVAEQESQNRYHITTGHAGRVRGRLSSLPASQERVALLSSRINELQNSIQYFGQQKRMLDISMHGGLPSVTQITNARPENTPVSPNIPVSVTLLTALAVLLAVGLAVVRDQFDDRVHTADTLESLGGYRVLTALPQVHRGFRGLVTERESPAALLESFRILRANVLLSMLDPLPRIIMVTSPQAGDGKSTTVANLAATIALSGKKVLVIDCDLRHPSLHRIYQVDNKVGLSSLLTGEAAIAEGIQATQIAGLEIIAAGPAHKYPPELLSSPEMMSLLNTLSSHFDSILLDSTPVVNLSDATVLAAMTHGIIVVVSSERTHQPELQATVRLLEQIGTPILGFVYNRSPETHALQWNGRR